MCVRTSVCVCVCLRLRLESSDAAGQLIVHGHEMDTPSSTVRCHTLLTFGLQVAFSNWLHILTLSPARPRRHMLSFGKYLRDPDAVRERASLLEPVGKPNRT